MIPAATLLAFVLTALVFVVIPGPSVLFVIGRALALGRAGALLTVLGNALGFLVQIAAIALGLGALIERSLMLFTVVKILGALFLVYLGVQAIRHRSRGIPGAAGVTTGRWRCLVEGAVVGVMGLLESGALVELLIKDGERYRTVKIDYHGGLKYPRLERIEGTPARLDDILAARK